MQLHELQREHPNQREKRVGRGGRRGKTSGRGHKGQKSRAGHSIRPAVRDIIKKLPKLRGHGKNRAKSVHSGRVAPAEVNLSALERAFEAGAAVTPQTLIAAGLIERRGGRMPPVKILADGELTKALSVSGCAASRAARERIVRAGGSVEIEAAAATGRK